MNKKLTIADLADIVSSKSGITKKESEQFVKDFFALATELISKGESLTIKGVGTFLPVWVDARTSVDVNTKQSIEIPGHYKLSFTPDKIMRDAVNAPFAAFTTEIVDVVVENKEEEAKSVVETKDLQPDTEAEITSISIAEEGVIDTSDVETKEEELQEANIEAVKEEINDQIEEQSENSSEGPNVEQQKIETIEEKVDSCDSNIDNVEENSDVVFDDEELKKEYRRHKRRGYISGFFTALILLAIFVSASIFLYNGGKEISISFSPFKITIVDGVDDNQETSSIESETEENNIEPQIVESQTAEFQVQEVSKTEESVTKEVKENEESKTVKKEKIIETIERGKFLTTIAEKYYGDKIFWVYIYRENSDRIWNPRDLKAGFKVVVPDAAKYNIDSSNPESVKRAKELEKQILYEIE